MGYTTDFRGQFGLNKKLDEDIFDDRGVIRIVDNYVRPYGVVSPARPIPR